MAKLELPVPGSCRCGEVQLRTGAQPILTMACHCNGCQLCAPDGFVSNARRLFRRQGMLFGKAT